MTVWRWVPVFLVSFISGCASGPATIDDGLAKPADDHLIIPHTRIGLIYKGMPLADARRILGAPTKAVYSPSDRSYGSYDFSSGIGLVAEGSAQRVRTVLAYSSSFKTREGAAVGASEADVRVRHGVPSERIVLNDAAVWLRYPGILFLLNKDRVTAIQITD